MQYSWFMQEYTGVRSSGLTVSPLTIPCADLTDLTLAGEEAQYELIIRHLRVGFFIFFRIWLK